MKLINKKGSLLGALMATIAFGLATDAARAAVVTGAISTPTGTEGTFRSDGTAQVGWTFTAATGAPSITELGIFVAPEGTVSDQGKTATGILMYNHTIAIYDATTTVVAMANISAGAVPDANQYAWVSLGTPLSLSAGQTYYVMTDMPGTTPDNDLWIPFSGGAGVTMSSEFGTFGGSVFSGSTMPTSVGGTSSLNANGLNGYIGPNIGYAIPEPTSFSLVGMGTLGLLFVRRRRLKS